MANPLSIMLWDLRNRFRHGPASPLKNQVIHVSPATITKSIDSTHPQFQNAVLGSGARDVPQDRRARLARTALRSAPNMIQSTDFDLFTRPLQDDPTIARIFAMLESDLTWQQAGFHDWMMEEIARKGSHDGCRTAQEVRKRYERLDELAQNMRNGKPLDPQTGWFGRYGSADGVIGAIGREGEVIFCGSGKHRLALAIGLGIATLPICLCAVHENAVKNGKWSALASGKDPLKPISPN